MRVCTCVGVHMRVRERMQTTACLELNMCVQVYVSMGLCKYVHVYMYAYEHTFISLHVRSYLYTYTSLHANLHVSMVWVCVYIYAMTRHLKTYNCSNCKRARNRYTAPAKLLHRCNKTATLLQQRCHRSATQLQRNCCASAANLLNCSSTRHSNPEMLRVRNHTT